MISINPPDLVLTLQFDANPLIVLNNSREVTRVNDTEEQRQQHGSGSLAAGQFCREVSAPTTPVGRPERKVLAMQKITPFLWFDDTAEVWSFSMCVFTL
jgi:hypothetical protein